MPHPQDFFTKVVAMRKHLTLFSIALLAVSLPVVAPAAFAQATPAEPEPTVVEGAFVGYDELPVQGLVITFRSEDGEVRGQGLTDAEGKYRVENLDLTAGREFTVVITVSGQELHKILEFRPKKFQVNTYDISMLEEAKRQKVEVTPEQARDWRESVEAQKTQGTMREHFDKAMKHLENKEYQEAVLQLETAASVDNTQVAVYSRLGFTYGELGQNAKGIEAYERAIELKPDSAALHNNAGQLYMRAGRSEDAMAAFEKAAELDPDNAGMFYYNLGVTLYNDNRLADATEPFRKAIEAEPQRANAHYFFGMCLFNQAEWKMDGIKAIMIPKPGTREAFETYLELAPKGEFSSEAQQSLETIELTAPK